MIDGFAKNLRSATKFVSSRTAHSEPHQYLKLYLKSKMAIKCNQMQRRAIFGSRCVLSVFWLLQTK